MLGIAYDHYGMLVHLNELEVDLTRKSKSFKVNEVVYTLANFNKCIDNTYINEFGKYLCIRSISQDTFTIIVIHLPTQRLCYYNDYRQPSLYMQDEDFYLSYKFIDGEVNYFFYAEKLKFLVVGNKIELYAFKNIQLTGNNLYQYYQQLIDSNCAHIIKLILDQ